MICRGESFRKDYGKIGSDIIARLSTTTVMVFSATASALEQEELIKKLGLRSPKMVNRNPDRPNIAYVKFERPPSTQTLDHLEIILQPIVDELISQKEEYPLTILYSDVSVIGFCYWFFEKKMGEQQYVGDSRPENRLFAQYHASYTEKMKTHIVSEICNDKSRIRIVFATVALGMGLNAKSVREVIHYKPPTSLSKYFQETGRAGRDGLPAIARLYYNATDIRSNRPGINSDIVKYCRNTTKCYRQIMLERFGYQVYDAGFDKKACCGFCALQE